MSNPLEHIATSPSPEELAKQQSWSQTLEEELPSSADISIPRTSGVPHVSDVDTEGWTREAIPEGPIGATRIIANEALTDRTRQELVDRTSDALDKMDKRYHQGVPSIAEARRQTEEDLARAEELRARIGHAQNQTKIHIDATEEELDDSLGRLREAA